MISFIRFVVPSRNRTIPTTLATHVTKQTPGRQPQPQNPNSGGVPPRSYKSVKVSPRVTRIRIIYGFRFRPSPVSRVLLLLFRESGVLRSASRCRAPGTDPIKALKQDTTIESGDISRKTRALSLWCLIEAGRCIL